MNILVVCTGNTCRSPMAEGILNNVLSNYGEKYKDVEVQSAGLFTMDGLSPSKEAIVAMKEYGIDIKDYSSNQITRDMINNADLILTMTSNHKKSILKSIPNVKDKVYTLKEYAYGIKEDVLDPYGQSIDVYKKTAKEIKDAVKKIVSSW